MLRFIGMFCTILFIVSCGKDAVDASVDAALLPYFQNFQAEAEERGVEFDIENARISGVITNIAGNNVIAQCTHNVNEPSKVTVDIDYWNQATEQEKEFYIFHELGHCFLKRGHDDSKDHSGNCLSIMHSSADACKFVYNGSSRDSYLDELFDK